MLKSSDWLPRLRNLPASLRRKLFAGHFKIVFAVYASKAGRPAKIEFRTSWRACRVNLEARSITLVI